VRRNDTKKKKKCLSIHSSGEKVRRLQTSEKREKKSPKGRGEAWGKAILYRGKNPEILGGRGALAYLQGSREGLIGRKRQGPKKGEPLSFCSHRGTRKQ